MAANDNDEEDGGLLQSGKILLLSAPQSGCEGPLKLYARLLSGDLGIEQDGREELWVLMTNRRRSRLRLFHIDGGGYSLTVRVLFDRSAVKEGLRLAAEGVSSLTRRELRLLLRHGSVPLGSGSGLAGDIAAALLKRF